MRNAQAVLLLVRVWFASPAAEIESTVTARLRQLAAPSTKSFFSWCTYGLLHQRQRLSLL